ncbi:hypothetical protein [Caldanaerobacter subterraneus]|uniref:Uncharacterized protein n=1 Tax=Caldanaerobacter subterraneus TaxID=911092 RepID=A0A7Y2L5G9_9THEO|nr:hypothetical protein [Caldanaerobacter subterraneus]NNG66147.1 hypothetical protein [Caldanaerobacter subterraneus]
MPSLDEYAEMLENLKNNLKGVDTMAKKKNQEKVVDIEKAVQEEKMIMISKEELEKMLDNLEYRLYKGLARKLNRIAQELKEAKKE